MSCVLPNFIFPTMLLMTLITSYWFAGNESQTRLYIPFFGSLFSRPPPKREFLEEPLVWCNSWCWGRLSGYQKLMNQCGFGWWSNHLPYQLKNTPDTTPDNLQYSCWWTNCTMPHHQSQAYSVAQLLVMGGSHPIIARGWTMVQHPGSPTTLATIKLIHQPKYIPNSCIINGFGCSCTTHR